MFMPSHARNSSRRRRPVTPRSPARRGSVLLIVIALMGMLLLVGIAFLSFAGQEEISAEYYAESSKNLVDPDLYVDVSEFALKQLIDKTNSNLRHSALYGSRHSLTSTLFGTDISPFTGQPINIAETSAGVFYVDMDHNGSADNAELLRPNYSYAAQYAAGGTYNDPPRFPPPDGSCTYPDINCMALAYIGKGLDASGNDVDVIIPSFHRPQYLRDGSGVPYTNEEWQTNTNTARLSLRPHKAHMTASNNVLRFINATETVLNDNGVAVPPFPFDEPGNPAQGTFAQGVWDATFTAGLPANYLWDVDNDGDGVKEGIWIDVDYPVQEVGDGRKFVPLVSMTMIDADGLINLNTAGNLAGVINPLNGQFNLSDPFGNGRFISRSNLAASRSEVSPLWALYADPSDSSFYTTTNEFRQHGIFFGFDASSPPVQRITMANMEWLFMNWGRAEFVDDNDGSFGYSAPGYGDQEPSLFYMGRWGELNRLQAGINSLSSTTDTLLFPAPGTKGYDDDVDYQNGIPGQAYVDGATGIIYPSFIHPLDYVGWGSYLSIGSQGMTATPTGLGLANDPARWLLYHTNYEDPGNYSSSLGALGVGFATWRDGGLGDLMQNISTNGTFDESDEVIVEYGLKAPGDTDSIFAASEMLGLHTTDADFTNTGETSRVQSLALFNFKLNKKAAEIRKQFTVMSYDRAQFGTPGLNATRNADGTISGLGNRFWEYNTDTDADWMDGNGNTTLDVGENPSGLEFPPAFLSLDASSAAEPIRQTLRRLLSVEVDTQNTNDRRLQFRLNLNQLLTGFQTVRGRTLPTYRALTPHPTSLGSATVPTTAPPYPPTTPAEQEYWARYDRQLMCRDIYTLLFVLGGGDDGRNYTDSSGGYTPDQMREMAQFAVNVVDDLDRDNVITRFEYDMELLNGWSVDDNPYTTSDVDRAQVFGVEAQQLTISEALVIYQKQIAANHAATLYDDMAADHYFAYVELRNASPFDVSLATGAWRLRRLDVGAAVLPATPREERQLIFLQGTVAKGGQFVIGTNDGTDTFVNGSGVTVHRNSDFRVDHDGDNTHWDRIIPAINDGGVDPMTDATPGCDLDLVHDSQQTGWFRMTAASSPATADTRGGMVLNLGSLPGESVRFVLERRADLTRTAPAVYDSNYDLDNPWIEVDRMSVNIRDFALAPGDDQTAFETARLPALQSKERDEPYGRFNGEQDHPNTGAADRIRANSFDLNGTLNNSNSVAWTDWQPHFDRDFSSPYDLLSIPLYGPDMVTFCLQLSKDFRRNRTDADGTTLPGCELTAGKKMLRPDWIDFGNPTSANSTNALLDNRWYRLLEFVDVPTRTHLGIQQSLNGPRLPGAINLNTIRTRGVLAGLIDDQDDPNTGALEGHLNPNFAATNLSTMLRDSYEGTGRDWWVQFLQSRDGVVQDGTNPIMAIDGYTLPGLPHAKPFRSRATVDPVDGNNSLQHTILRDLQADGTLYDRRQMFEARTQADLATQGGSNSVDLYTRHRLLRKIGNNSTTRSNVFIVYMTIRCFEAVENTATGDVRIGGELAGNTDRRGFFIVDRSLPEEAFDRNTGTFNYSKFVAYRKRLQ